MKSRKQSNPKTVPPASSPSKTVALDDIKSKVFEEFKNRIERVDGVPCLKPGRHFDVLLGDSKNTKSAVQQSFPFEEQEAFAVLTTPRKMFVAGSTTSLSKVSQN